MSDLGVERLGQEELRITIRNLASVMRATSGELAVCIAIVAAKRYWEVWKFESLEAYAEEELGISRAIVSGYLQAGRMAITMDLPLAKIKKLGKGKLIALSAIKVPEKLPEALMFAEEHNEKETAAYCRATAAEAQAVPASRQTKQITFAVPTEDFDEAERLCQMLMLEQKFTHTGEAVLFALRQYWSKRPERMCA